MMQATCNKGRAPLLASLAAGLLSVGAPACVDGGLDETETLDTGETLGETSGGEASGGETSGGETSGGDGGDTNEDTAVGAPQPPLGRLVIDEIYFTGSPPFGDVDHYFSDQFIALRNVSDEPVAAGGLLIGDVFGLAGEINPGSEPDGLAEDHEHVYMLNLWRIPGAPEEVILGPGERLVIAQDGTNHSPFSAVDLSGADFETYVDESGKDEDYPTVANLELLHYNAGFDWLITVFGPSVVIASFADEAMLAEAAELYDYQGQTLIQLPAGAVVDGVDVVMDAASADFKRLPPAVDRGFTFASGTYTGEAVMRRRSEGRSLDTDDSSADFEVTSAPAPWR